jgi:transcriptional regulator with XRE-family HTH domain
MANTLAERVRERMEAMGTNPTALARTIGRDKDFIRQLLSGKKRTISSDAVADLARVFGCEPSDLLGTKSSGLVPGTRETVLDGTIEAETWRRPEDDFLRGNTVPMSLRSSEELGEVLFYQFRGPTNEMGICHGALISAVPLRRAPEHGDLLVVERHMGELLERSIRRVDGAGRSRLIPLEGAKSSEPISADADGVEIVGRVISAAQFF